MNKLSKICDGADWFDPEFQKVLNEELQEPARFHRKQWEFVTIFLTLQKYGMLKADKLGLSLGGGNERVLYSIARHIKQLVVTDLYDNETSWDCARTDDPDEFIKASKPFAVEDKKLKALRMDMRYLDFAENSFDFCYSSCAIEHIGKFEDFVQHLNEVYRCLKEDGIYVFTTELQLGDTTIKDPNNYIFSPAYLNYIIEHNKLTPDCDPDISITEHSVNFPLPSNIAALCYNGEKKFSDQALSQLPHLTQLRGKYPFTSILLIMRKSSQTRADKKVNFINLEQTESFVTAALNNYKDILKSSVVSFQPFSSLPDGVSRFYLDHSDFFKDHQNKKGDNETPFHTDYFWLSEGERQFSIKLLVDSAEELSKNILQLRIHRYAITDSEKVKCIFEKDIVLKTGDYINEDINIIVNEEYCYAVLAKIASGSCTFKNISITSGLTQLATNTNEIKNFRDELSEIIS